LVERNSWKKRFIFRPSALKAERLEQHETTRSPIESAFQAVPAANTATFFELGGAARARANRRRDGGPATTPNVVLEIFQKRIDHRHKIAPKSTAPCRLEAPPIEYHHNEELTDRQLQR